MIKVFMLLIGIITSPSGAPVAEYQVTALDASNVPVKPLVTPPTYSPSYSSDSNGLYYFADGITVPNGEYLYLQEIRYTDTVQTVGATASESIVGNFSTNSANVSVQLLP